MGSPKIKMKAIEGAQAMNDFSKSLKQGVWIGRPGIGMFQAIRIGLVLLQVHVVLQGAFWLPRGELGEFKLQFTRRDINKAADWIVKRAKHLEQSFVWNKDWPPDLIKLM
ncbi:hypothetical protein Cni_G25753 [Canna indica]|uniref:Uncharacterized protein n=1 Tax=Canna indica TaxID=4628 RepID=A0AAQ3QQQ6_9LILI|nr:hypothetical protein Cni_G25753 [Canna indica]